MAHLFKVEYAKSGRSKCKKCKSEISQGELRIAVLTIPSGNVVDNIDLSRGVTSLGSIEGGYWDHNGEQWRWHHLACFSFDRQKALQDGSDFVEGSFSSIKKPDQAKVLAMIASGSKGKPGAGTKAAAASPAKKATPAKGKKRAADDEEEDEAPKKKAKAAPAKKPASKSSSKESSLSGKTVVFTGALKMLRKEAEEVARQHGAKVTGSISGKTEVVVAGPGAGGKLEEARSRGVEIWTEDEFRKAVGL
eukprot:TRINITY_DN7263_c0_g1_i1.p1 TRINITY_DN7263_c0_g1~~TRINITY_DN7263_c0_g1_i1.p1  ORF type:complete len:249 (+),score=66.71 TRINITY_DN7263_c0_g1_i1:135-881(+)